MANVQPVILLGALLMYLMAVLGNLIIATLVCVLSELHTPMYFFLGNLSVQDLVLASTIQPKLLHITITGNSKISFQGCITQIFLFVMCVVNEFFLLTSMAYDRYVAICFSLHYSRIMNWRMCSMLAMNSWLISAINSLIYSFLMSKLSFCDVHEINHFFCDVKMILSLSCSDIAHMIQIIYMEAVFFGLIPFALILTSYVYIISTIVKINSSEGRLKAFSSCSSHLTVVILFYGTSLSLNTKPDSETFREQDKLLSMLYTLVVPMLNPLVYSLRNKQVLKAIKKVLKC
ncbi:olfactory receptor 1E16-like [Rhinophrynus dorsalis]